MLILHRATIALGMLTLTSGLGGHAHAQENEPDECFDLEVPARIIAQVSTILPKSDDGSILMNWPWFLDLEVKGSNGGGLPAGKITVVTLQHTCYRSNLGIRWWKLRRNDRGSFNLIGLAADSTSVRCAADSMPAVAYIRFQNGEMLDQLRQEGEKRYGRGLK